MIRRRVLGLAGALALAGMLGVGATAALNVPSKAAAGCSCCGDLCACTACVCDATAKTHGCDCCGNAACCPATAAATS